jgi:hypothetical protein
MRASAAARARLAPLPPEHERLAAALRDAGLSPNSAGSGGSVVAVLPPGHDLDRLRADIAAIGGGLVMQP